MFSYFDLNCFIIFEHLIHRINLFVHFAYFIIITRIVIAGSEDIEAEKERVEKGSGAFILCMKTQQQQQQQKPQQQQ